MLLSEQFELLSTLFSLVIELLSIMLVNLDYFSPCHVNAWRMNMAIAVWCMSSISASSMSPTAGPPVFEYVSSNAIYLMSNKIIQPSRCRGINPLHLPTCSFRMEKSWPSNDWPRIATICNGTPNACTDIAQDTKPDHSVSRCPSNSRTRACRGRLTY